MSLTDAEINRLERVIRRRGPCRNAQKAIYVDSARRSASMGFDPLIRFDDHMVMMCAGGYVEDTTELLAKANEELDKSRELLRDTVNQTRTISDVVTPMLLERVTQLRSTRMALANESALSLQALRDVRKFFIESQYEVEMQHIERFLALCDRLKELKRDGTLDAISDVVIRLAIQGGEKNDERK